MIGEVYLAEDSKLGRKVALLLLPDQFTRDVDRVQRLADEARIISTLNHPNIRMMYEINSELINGQPQYFIANEWVEGPTLREHLGYTRMRLDEVLDVTMQIATGLSAAHAAGVLHRDLKPENVMIRPDGYVKILDFGLAKLVEQDSMMVELSDSLKLPAEAEASKDAATDEIRIEEIPQGDPFVTRPLNSNDLEGISKRTTQINQQAHSSAARSATGLWWMPGTTGYLSPEQIQGEMVDERSDLFSLGVVIYEMCTGRVPFEGQTTTTVLSSILQTAPPPIERAMPDAPEELDWIVNRLLAKDRDERYQTARELLSDLKRLRQRLDFDAEQGRLRDSGKASGKQVSFETTPLRRESGRNTGAIGSRLSSSSGKSRATGEVVDSVAVLPLANIGNDPNTEYLSDGITESIINSLARLSGVRVMARSTVFRYKGKNADPLAVGRELNVRAVFAGRLIQRKDELIVKAELVDAVDGSVLWAEQYQRKAGDIFELEKDIAKQISESLRVKLSGEQQQNMARRQTANPEAYELYLRGLFFWNQRNLETFSKAIECFIQALRKDPNYAQAYAGLANCYILASVYSLPPREFVPKARMAITKALALDNQLGDAYASLGALSLWYDWDFLAAEKHFARAIELNPNDPNPHMWKGYLYASQERIDDAVRMMQYAEKLDPLSVIITTNLGEVLYRGKRYDQALAQFAKALEMDSNFSKAFYWRSLTQIMLGRPAEAIAFLEPAIKTFVGETKILATFLLMLALERAGQHETAQQIFSMLEDRAKNAYVPPYYLALAHATFGDNEKAFDWLEKAYQERSGWLPWMKLEPLLEGLRTDARFIDLMRRIGLQP